MALKIIQNLLATFICLLLFSCEPSGGSPVYPKPPPPEVGDGTPDPPPEVGDGTPDPPPEGGDGTPDLPPDGGDGTPDNGDLLDGNFDQAKFDEARFSFVQANPRNRKTG